MALVSILFTMFYVNKYSPRKFAALHRWRISGAKKTIRNFIHNWPNICILFEYLMNIQLAPAPLFRCSHPLAGGLMARMVERAEEDARYYDQVAAEAGANGCLGRRV